MFDGAIPTNPCPIRGAVNSKRVHKVEPALLEQLEAIMTALLNGTGRWSCWRPGAPCALAK